MQGLQKKLSTHDASIMGINAGLDMICIGNNLLPEDSAVLETVAKIRSTAQLEASIGRVQERKHIFRRAVTAGL